jgi:hypothetical protein
MSTSVPRVNVYVDAFNLYYGCLKGTPFRWLDLEALSRRYVRAGRLHRVRYFTANVTPRPDDPRAPQRQQAYLRALRTIPFLTVHLGRFQESEVRMRLADPPRGGPTTVVVRRTEEKGSDVNLASHLLMDAMKGDFELALVVSNDSDLCEPIRMTIREAGRPVGVLIPHDRASIDIARIPPTFIKRIRRGALAASQFPDVIHDARGPVHRPPGW